MDNSAFFFQFLIPAVAYFATALFVAIILIWILLRNSKPKQAYEPVPRHGYGVESVTLNGERVKSIGEKRIADYFKKSNINYVYEQFLSYRIGSPDFYLPDYRVYVEYWGLVKADDSWARAKYVRSMRRRMAIYHRNNIKFISIYPDNLENLDWVFRAKFRKVTGIELPN